MLVEVWLGLVSNSHVIGQVRLPQLATALASSNYGRKVGSPEPVITVRACRREAQVSRLEIFQDIDSTFTSRLSFSTLAHLCTLSQPTSVLTHIALAITMKLQADAAVSATLLACLLPFAAAQYKCAEIKVDRHTFDLSKLSGPHSVQHNVEQPPSSLNTTYTVDVCKPLVPEGDNKDERCPGETQGKLS